MKRIRVIIAMLAIMISIYVINCSFTSFIVYASDEYGSLQVKKSDGSAVLFENGNWQLKDGIYDISGTAQDYEGIIVSGNSTINLSDATILQRTNILEKNGPAISIASGKVNLVLNGESTIEGNKGYAGIYVAPGASLNISGDGVLNARGGDGKGTYTLPANLQTDTQKRGFTGGGAGIGGNGLLVNTNTNQPILGLINCFGDITINGGTINAIGGGIPYSPNNGGGAGIGAGGISSANGMNNTSSGNIYIKGGIVNATGGKGQTNSLTGGGAGIGSGGVTGSYWEPYNNNVKISISGGIVNAIGTDDGAGIGGGTNTDSGVIEITGGTIKAIGGYEIENGNQSGAYGGAGIGGGDSGGVNSITITGGTIFAKAVGAAAGIGAGNDGFVGTNNYVNDTTSYSDIYIGGNAKVTAIGGKKPNKFTGGAGIGAGQSHYNDNGFGSISIMDNAKVRAYAGPSAQAIGVGSNYAGTSPNKFHVGSNSIDVWLFNHDTTFGAFWGQTDQGDGLTEDYSSEGATAIWYTKPADGIFPSENTNTTAYTDSKAKLSWNYSNNTLHILTELEEILEENYEGTLGNWATFTNVNASYKVEYYDINGNEIQKSSIRTAPIGENVSVTVSDKVIQGYTFNEKNKNNILSAIVTKDDTILKLYFKKNATPVLPISPAPPATSNPDKDNINNENPNTGDNLIIYSILFIVSSLGIAMSLIFKKINI